jgi:5-methylthioribose kinase
MPGIGVVDGGIPVVEVVVVEVEKHSVVVVVLQMKKFFRSQGSVRHLPLDRANVDTHG